MSDDDRDRCIRLRELGERLPIPEWRELTWADCIGCGGPLWGPADDRERLYDGDPLVCLDPECGLVHSMSADSEGCEVVDRRTVDDRWAYLTEAALLGARRLIGGAK